MSAEAQQTVDWVGHPMASPLMRHFCKFIICRNAQASERIEKLRNLAEDPSDYDSLKETLLYLEYADWSASEARLQRDLDLIDRAGPALDAGGNEVDNHAANPNLNRGWAEKGEDLTDLKTITVTIGEHERMFTYPNADSMDPNSQKDINGLNRWRHKVIRENIGRQKFGRIQGNDFHQIEEDYLLNRYADQKIDNRGRWGIADVTTDYNAIFKGMYLPGRYQPCEERSKDSVTSLIQRKAVSPREHAKQAGPKPSLLKKHELAQDKIADVWRQRYAENEAALDEEGEDDPQGGGEEPEEDADDEMTEVDEPSEE